MSHQETIIKELEQSASVLQQFIQNSKNILDIETAAHMMCESLKAEGKILSCGNGGSACDAMHFAEELTGRFRENRESYAAIAISDPGYITCAANDFGFAEVFSRYISGVGRQGDILLAISTSGNSENILKAAMAAKLKGMKVISLTGKDGGKLAPISDLNINVAHNGYADRIQEVHIKIIHIIILTIERIMKTP